MHRKAHISRTHLFGPLAVTTGHMVRWTPTTPTTGDSTERASPIWLGVSEVCRNRPGRLYSNGQWGEASVQGRKKKKRGGTDKMLTLYAG